MASLTINLEVKSRTHRPRHVLLALLAVTMVLVVRVCFLPTLAVDTTPLRKHTRLLRVSAVGLRASSKLLLSCNKVTCGGLCI